MLNSMIFCLDVLFVSFCSAAFMAKLIGMLVKSAQTSKDTIFSSQGTHKVLIYSKKSLLFLIACPFFCFTQFRILARCLAQPSETLPSPETIRQCGMLSL